MAKADSGPSPSTSRDPAGEDKDDEPIEKKQTVLETHGYSLGKTIGTGSYATVKVITF